jgi:recombination protein RecT
MSTEVVRLKDMLGRDEIKARLNEILGKKAATFATSIVQVVQSSAMLSKAEPSSVLNSAMTAATLDLPLNNSLGFAYIVPYNARQSDGTYKTVAQFQLGYKGFIQLAQRTGLYKTIDAKPVYDGQLVPDSSFTGYMFDWSQKKSDQVIGYAAYFQLLNGFEKTLYMSVAELQTHGSKYSQSYRGGHGLWKDEFETMAKKTTLKLLLSKFGPMSIDLQQAVTLDQAVISDTGTAEYVDNGEPRLDPDTVFVKELIEKAETEQDLDVIEQSIEGAVAPELVNELQEKRKKVKK